MSAEVVTVGFFAKSIQGFIGAILGLVGPGVFALNWIKKKDKADEEHARKLQELELKTEKFLTRDDVKGIVEESIEPIQENVDKIQKTCDDTNNLLQEFITQFKMFQAVEEYKERLERKDE